MQDPPLLELEIFCLAMIIGDKGDSGYDPGFDGSAKRREVYADFSNDSRASLDPRSRIMDQG